MTKAHFLKLNNMTEKQYRAKLRAQHYIIYKKNR